MKINFEVQCKLGARSDRISSIKNPTKYPSFVLNHNDDWNDYGYYTWFSLFYVKSENEKFLIGELKIMHKNTQNTYDIINKQFERLSDDYCSLGITTDYYRNLKCHFSVEECKGLLAALQDCSMRIDHYERYKDTSAFTNSLSRDLSSERARREAKYIITGRSLENAYSISYLFHPKYNISTNVPFYCKFNAKAKSYFRSVGIIGENGVGKTTMLSDLIDSLINDRKKDFEDELPLFSCVMSICTTPYDSFSKVKKEDNNSLLSYYYFCAGQQKDETEKELESSIKIIRKRTLKSKSVFTKYEEILKFKFPEIDIAQLWVDEKEDVFKIKSDTLSAVISSLSSGQLQLLLLITFIFAQINFDSLLIIDEPEVHLHPKAIRDLFSLLSNMLDIFQSFCIVSTHSPLIIREIPGQNVFMMRRLNDVVEIGKINIETLGEDISILYDKIFGYDDSNTYLSKTVRKMVADGNSDYKEVVRKLNNDGKPLSLNARFMVKQIVDDEKSK